MKIQFCEVNFQFGTDETRSKLENEYKELDIDVSPCLGVCGECYEGPFAIVDDEMIQAETSEELYEKIKGMIN